jgi:hypothetical protein
MNKKALTPGFSLLLKRVNKKLSGMRQAYVLNHSFAIAYFVDRFLLGF